MISNLVYKSIIVVVAGLLALCSLESTTTRNITDNSNIHSIYSNWSFNYEGPVVVSMEEGNSNCPELIEYLDSHKDLYRKFWLGYEEPSVQISSNICGKYVQTLSLEPMYATNGKLLGMSIIGE